ncbi:MAG: threonine ammonia-lyase [Clostridia bacterium]
MTIKDIEQAQYRLQGVIHKTPIEPSKTFSKMTGASVYLKFENLQKTGSFKIRGAYNKIAVLAEGEKPSSVVASSAGNHAQGVAFGASQLGIPATIVMPRSAPIAKVSATEGYGAKVVLHGTVYDDSYNRAMEICEEEKGVFIHPFNDKDVIAGQGTIGLEILADLPLVDIVVVPAGGGGLLAGIACCIKNINPRIKVIGVQASGANAIEKSFGKDKVVQSEFVRTIADGIAVKNPGDVSHKYINKYVDEIVTVSDDELAETLLLLLERSKQVIEPAGAVSLSAVLNNKIDVKDKKVACILSGGNIDVSFIHRVIQKGLVKRGRQMKFSTILPDVPGSLVELARSISNLGANIVMVSHDRVNVDLSLDEAIIHIGCEVGSQDHGLSVVEGLTKLGYKITLE